MEIWKDIEGYEGFYQVSNYGRVKSLNYNRTGKAKELKQSINLGYKYVILYKDNKRKKFLVHRLVAQAFVPNPNEYLEVNHIDENKANNCVWNLEWCTRLYNNNYGTINERISKAKKGKKHTEEAKKKMSERKKKRIQCLNNGQIFNSITEACIWCGLKNNSGIIEQIKGKQNYAGKDPVTGEKLQWKYID